MKLTCPKALIRSALLVFISLVQADPAAGAPLVTVKVIIERVRALDDFEFGGAEDFYAVVTIAGFESDNEDTPEQQAFEDMEDIYPGYEFAARIDSALGTIPIEIEIRDEDGFLRFADDHVDVTPTPGRNVDLVLDLSSCSISGDVIGDCDATIVTLGTQDERAELWFRVEVGAATSDTDLRLTCTHSPLWPQASDMVTITANALDASLAAKFPPADEIEIFVDDGDVPAVQLTLTSTATAAVGPFDAGSTFFYGCRIRAGGSEVWSDWRIVGVGPPPAGRATPVVYTGSRSNSIDIVFIPDRGSYTGPTDPQFLTDVSTAIGRYYAEDVFLRHQDQISFWLARDSGDAQDGCDSEAPDNWDDDYTFADTGAILHRNSTIRDCAPGGERFFSACMIPVTTFPGCRGANPPRIVLHETGHRPFGLADEYCCDGGYFMNDPLPNVYSEPLQCIADIADLSTWDTALGVTPRTAASCREFEEDRFWFFDVDWSVSDPAVNDLMVDNLTPGGADVRRIEWLFGRCDGADC